MPVRHHIPTTYPPAPRSGVGIAPRHAPCGAHQLKGQAELKRQEEKKAAEEAKRAMRESQREYLGQYREPLLFAAGDLQVGPLSLSLLHCARIMPHTCAQVRPLWAPHPARVITGGVEGPSVCS